MTEKKNYYAWIILLCAALMNLMFLGFAWNTNQLYMSSVLGDYPDFTRTAYALTVTLNGLTNAGFSMIFGKVVKKIGAKVMIVIGVACSAGSLMLYSIATNLAMFYLGAITMGVSIAFITTTMSAMLVNNWFAKHNGTILAITTTASGLGGTLFPPLVAGWITNLSWRTSFRYTALICLVTGIVIIFLVRITPQKMGLKPLWSSESGDQSAKAAADLPGVTMAEAKKGRNLWCITIMYFMMGVIIYSVQQTTAIYISTLGFTTVQAGYVISTLFIANMLSQIPLGALSDKLGVGKVLPVGLCIFSLALVLLIVPNMTLERMHIVGAIIGFSVVLMSVMVPIVVREIFGVKDFASILGFVIGIRTIGIAIGTPLINLFFDITGSYQNVFAIYLFGMAVCIALSILGTRKVKA